MRSPAAQSEVSGRHSVQQCFPKPDWGDSGPGWASSEAGTRPVRKAFPHLHHKRLAEREGSTLWNASRVCITKAIAQGLATKLSSLGNSSLAQVVQRATAAWLTKATLWGLWQLPASAPCTTTRGTRGSGGQTLPRPHPEQGQGIGLSGPDETRFSGPPGDKR